jgi:Domain of unknown function (DUF397)
MPSNEVMLGASLNWHRASSYQTGECFEIATVEGVVVMRSSAHPDAGYIYFSPEEFSSFLAEVALLGTCQPAAGLRLAS